MELVWPAAEYLPGYVDALERGWSPNTSRPEAAAEELARVAADPEGFVAEQLDRKVKRPSRLPDGSLLFGMAGFERWIHDGEFCGLISLRWLPGELDVAPHLIGHIGYSVVPWKQRRGYATRALALLLPDARAEGLPFVELVTEASNVASVHVIEANGGELVEHFSQPELHDGAELRRYRIQL